MKKVIGCAVMAVIITASLAGCKKAIQKLFPGIDAEVPEIVVTIPLLPSGLPVPDEEIALPPYTKHFNLDSTIKANTGGSFGAGDVSSVKLKEIVFTVKSPDSANNLSNFESARFTFQSNSNTTPVEIASFTFPDTYTTTSVFVAPSNTPDLISYIRGTELTYNVYGKLRRYPTKEMKLAVKVTLRIK